MVDQATIDAALQPFEDVRADAGMCRWTDVATAIGQARRVLADSPDNLSEGDLDRLRETNRKLHRRVQIAEATAQSVQDQLGDWIEVFSSSFYRTEGRRQNERGFIIYILRDIRRRAAKLADRAALSATKGAE